MTLSLQEQSQLAAELREAFRSYLRLCRQADQAGLKVHIEIGPASQYEAGDVVVKLISNVQAAPD